MHNINILPVVLKNLVIFCKIICLFVIQTYQYDMLYYKKNRVISGVFKITIIQVSLKLLKYQTRTNI